LGDYQTVLNQDFPGCSIVNYSAKTKLQKMFGLYHTLYSIEEEDIELIFQDKRLKQ